MAVTNQGRLSFPHVWSPQEEENPSGDYKGYACCLLFESREDIEEVVEAVKTEAKASHPKIPFDELDNIPFKEVTHPETGEPAWSLNFKRQTKYGRPVLLTRGKKPITDEEMLYAGCWVRIVYNTYAYSHPGNKGVGLGMQLVQFLRDDQPFGGDPASQLDDLEDIDDTTDGSDLEDLLN